MVAAKNQQYQLFCKNNHWSLALQKCHQYGIKLELWQTL